MGGRRADRDRPGRLVDISGSGGKGLDGSHTVSIQSGASATLGGGDGEFQLDGGSTLDNQGTFAWTGQSQVSLNNSSTIPTPARSTCHRIRRSASSIRAIRS